MTLRIQIIVGLVLVISLITIVNMIRKKKLELKYALSWLCVITALLIMDVFPDMMSFIAKAMGVETPINMLIFFGFCFSLLIIFTLTISLSRMSNRLKRLAQKVALMEKRMREEEER